MQSRFRLWHVGTLAAVAVLIGVTSVVWPRPESTLLAPEKLQRSMKTRWEYEEFFGWPNSDPQIRFSASDRPRVYFAWADSVSIRGRTIIRRLDVAFSPAGEYLDRRYSEVSKSNLLDELHYWARRGLPK